MCKMASFVLTKDNVYWSQKTDSHEDILTEFNLKESGLAGKIEILRVEIAPENGDYLTPREKWKYRNDQDLLPDWADAEKDEARTRTALESWWKSCVVDVGEKIEKMEGSDFKKICYGAINEMRESASVNEMWESASVKEMRESASVNVMRESASVKEMWGSASVKEMRESASVNEMWGSASVKEMRESASVKEMRESASVKEMRGQTCVTTFCVITPKISEEAVLIDRSGKKVKAIFAEDK